MRLIDADELKIDYGFTYSDITPTHEEMYALIDRQKTVESVRKTGRWEVTPVYIKCSECGESFMLIPQNYCPNCGAKMEVEHE